MESNRQKSAVWYVTSAAGFGLIFAWCANLAIAAANDKPNVLFICVDDMNDWVGCLGGYPGVKTPNIDRLAERGVLFTNAHCTSPKCGPSRAAIHTGLPGHRQ